MQLAPYEPTDKDSRLLILRPRVVLPWALWGALALVLVVALTAAAVGLNRVLHPSAWAILTPTLTLTPTARVILSSTPVEVLILPTDTPSPTSTPTNTPIPTPTCPPDPSKYGLSHDVFCGLHTEIAKLSPQ